MAMNQTDCPPSRRWYPAFQHRNFRLFFLAQVISLNGTWMQLVAEGWVVYELTESPRALGITRFLHTFPVTLITLSAGLLADRADKRKILMLTQLFSMIFAGWLTIQGFSGSLSIWQLWIAATGIGICHAFDIPARQSFVVEMVGRKDLMNALFVNSSVFNGARIVGPGIAGIILAGFQPSWCFLINTLSFAATIYAYSQMRNLYREPASDHFKSVSFKDALTHIRRDPLLLNVLCMISMASIFTAPFVAQIPSIAKEWFQLGPKGYGSLMMANGCGAFLAAILLTLLKSPEWKKWIFPLGTTFFALSVMALAHTRTLAWAHLLLGINGIAMIATFSTANTLVQLNSPQSMRGRIMGIYTFCFIGLSPFGNLLMGELATQLDLKSAISFAGIVGLIASFALAWRIPAIKASPTSGD